MSIQEDQAYIAIRPDGFVDGACFTQSGDTAAWLKQMQQSGFTVEVRNRAEARSLVFTNIKATTMLA